MIAAAAPSSPAAVMPPGNREPRLSAREVHDRLTTAVRGLHAAERNAVLWFAEVLNRRLHLELGFGSIRQYAREALGFSPSRTSQFIRLATSLEELPALRAAMQAGEVSWTTAREVTRVATPETDRRWTDAARTRTRESIAEEIQRLREAAGRSRRRKAQGGQLTLGDGVAGDRPPGEPGATHDSRESGDSGEGGGGSVGPATSVGSADGSVPGLDIGPEELPVHVGLRFAPAEHARLMALWERLRKLGHSGSRESLVLAGLESLVIEMERERGRKPGADGSEGRRHSARPSHRVVITVCPECEAAERPGGARGRKVTGAELRAALCDADVVAPGRRTRAIIPPGRRAEILRRDGQRCRTAGCGSAHFLEVHHIVPRERGGTNAPENLITLCSGCHRAAHHHDHRPEHARRRGKQGWRSWAGRNGKQV